MNWKVACLGECMLELSNPGGRPLERDMSLRFSFGGDTLNTAVYLARIGVASSYITALGDDPYSHWLLEEWTEEGVDVALIESIPGRNPGLYMIQIDSQGERSFHYWRQQSAARELLAEELRARRVLQNLMRFDLVYLSGITLSLFDDLSLERLFSGLQAYRGKGGRVAFDANYRPAGWPDLKRAKQTMRQAFEMTDIALPTFDDEARLHGDSCAEQTVERLHSLGVAEVVVKQDVKGSYVSDGAFQGWVETEKVARVIDSTAAGDSFNAGYIAAKSTGLESPIAAQWGNRLAGKVIQHPGAIIPRAAMPMLEA